MISRQSAITARHILLGNPIRWRYALKICVRLHRVILGWSVVHERLYEKYLAGGCTDASPHGVRPRITGGRLPSLPAVESEATAGVSP